MEALVYDSLKRTRDIFVSNSGHLLSAVDDMDGKRIKIKVKTQTEYSAVKDAASITPAPAVPITMPATVSTTGAPATHVTIEDGEDKVDVRGPHPYPLEPGVILDAETAVRDELDEEVANKVRSVLPPTAAQTAASRLGVGVQAIVPVMASEPSTGGARSIIPISPITYEKPMWHAPWKLMRVISGHVGWVRSVAVDPSNEWFVTGSADKTIKIWDLASGVLKLTLTGHISAVRGLAVSERHPYLFSAGEDKQVRCWDLETNKTIRQYHGHLSAIYCCALHPTLDVLMTGGRDATVRVWDIRTKAQIHVLGGHNDIVDAVKTQATDPQVITGSADKTVKLWDLASGKSIVTLTNHKKSVRALAVHPREHTFVSGASDNIKKWLLPDGKFLHNMSGHNAIINTLALNQEGVLISGADNGSLCAWDWKTGYKYQNFQSAVQPGSLDSEAGILASAFDLSGSRLITVEVDKSIKVWKEDETATPETHPIGSDWKYIQQQNKKW